MSTPTPERDKALDAALAQIDKQYGKGSIMRMGEKGSMAIELLFEHTHCIQSVIHSNR